MFHVGHNKELSTVHGGGMMRWATGKTWQALTEQDKTRNTDLRVVETAFKAVALKENLWEERGVKGKQES